MSLMFISEGFPYMLYDLSDPDLLQPSPLLLDAWELWLQGHPDVTFVNAVLTIIQKGAKIGYQGPSLTHCNKNHFLALSAPAILSEDLQKQLQHKQLVKVKTDETQFVCSPLGLVPKHDGGWRSIHDLSYPYGNLVNNGIPQHWGALEYTTFDDAVAVLLQQGLGALLVKWDLKEAFKHILMAMSDQWLLGFFCDDCYYLEQYLPLAFRHHHSFLICLPRHSIGC